MTDTTNDTSGTDDQQADAQVSEMSVMGGDSGPEEIQPHDATAGDPSDESGQTQEGTVGPNASPEENRGLSDQESPAP